jgi:hypothetical protein
MLKDCISLNVGVPVGQGIDTKAKSIGTSC